MGMKERCVRLWHGALQMRYSQRRGKSRRCNIGCVALCFSVDPNWAGVVPASTVRTRRIGKSGFSRQKYQEEYECHSVISNARRAEAASHHKRTNKPKTKNKKNQRGTTRTRRRVS